MWAQSMVGFIDRLNFVPDYVGLAYPVVSDHKNPVFSTGNWGSGGESQGENPLTSATHTMGKLCAITIGGRRILVSDP